LSEIYTFSATFVKSAVTQYISLMWGRCDKFVVGVAMPKPTVYNQSQQNIS